MSRWGYLTVVIMIIALGLYAFAPFSSSSRSDTVKVWSGTQTPPGTFEVFTPGQDQEIRGELMKLNGHFRRVDPEHVHRFWDLLGQVSVPAQAVIGGVAESQLAAYGIDGHHGLSADGRNLRWGQSGGNGYVWDGSRMMALPLPGYLVLVQAAQRLDDPKLLFGVDTASRLLCGDLSLEQVDNHWQDSQRPQRPGLQIRMSRLIGLINGLRLEELKPSAATATVLMRMTISIGHPASDHQLVISRTEHGAQVTIDDLPPQSLGGDAVNTWDSVIRDLKRDWLLDFDGVVASSQVKSMVVGSGTARWFDAHRLEGAYRVGDTHWELTWEGGSENASEAAVDKIFSALCAVAVDHADPGPYPAPATPFAKVFTLYLQNGGTLVLHIDGLNVWTNDYHGRLNQPDALSEIQPADLLQLSLVTADPQRIMKLQRLSTLAPALKEVVTRSESGIWSRTYPAVANVDPVGIGRVTRALCGASALSARLDTDEDHAALTHPELTLDVRLAPLAEGAPRMEIVNERDTVSQNRGFCFYQDQKGHWRAVDVEGGVSYQVDNDLVEVLSAPFQSDAIFPLVPALVKRLEIATVTAHFALSRGNGGWTLQDLAATPAPGSAAVASPVGVDELEVRRYLRQLSELSAATRHPEQDAVLPAQAALVVSCDMPAVDGEERLVLTMGTPDGQGADISVSSTLSGSSLPPGRNRVGQEIAQALLVTPQRFLPMSSR